MFFRCLRAKNMTTTLLMWSLQIGVLNIYYAADMVIPKSSFSRQDFLYAFGRKSAYVLSVHLVEVCPSILLTS